MIRTRPSRRGTFAALAAAVALTAACQSPAEPAGAPHQPTAGGRAAPAGSNPRPPAPSERGATATPWPSPASTTPANAQPPAQPPAPQPPPTADRWWGVTIDDVSDIGHVAESLAALPRRPIVRMVFDKGQTPADYAAAVRTIQPVAAVLATPVDSSDAKDYTVDQYVSRFRDYLSSFGSGVAVWEIGNEVNGEWTGDRAGSAAKAAAAFDVVHAAGGRTALTLYYNPRCAADPANAMLPYARTQLPERLKSGVDEVLVSYYEGDCDNHRPTEQEWRDVFTELRSVFPTARLGFGEIGAPQSAEPAAKADYLRRYYSMPAPIQGFLGGFFWWYYAEDAVPYATSPVWAALRTAMAPAGS